MAEKQDRAFNQSLAGRVAGECLKNVREGYSIPAKYPTAIEAWNHTQQHQDRNIPVGVDVPLYYSYGTAGHINVRLRNGQVWSDGNIYVSLDDYLSKHPSVHYLGWGESVDDIRVIEYAPDPAPSGMPPVGSHVQFLPTQTRTTFHAGTTNTAGHISVTDNSFIYQVRGYDPKFPGRIIIDSASGGGDGIAVALYYTNGTKISGWKQV